MEENRLSPETLNQLLFQWYEQARRKLPWREERSAYKVLLSELMLQQTQVPTALPYFQRFLERWPSLKDLAQASSRELREAWAGLGYYRRAENLGRCARAVLEFYDGELPHKAAQLQKLPGIGPYTAAAIASMAYGEAEPSVDGNLLRVLSRLSAMPWQAGREKDRKEAVALARGLISRERPGDWNEALMDLASSLCLPASCAAENCPLATLCRAYRRKEPLAYPLKARTTEKKSETFDYLILLQNDAIYLQERKQNLLQGFSEFLILPADWKKGQLLSESGQPLQPRKLGELRRVFSHRIWELGLYLLQPEPPSFSLRLLKPNGKIEDLPLPGSFVQPGEARARLIPFLADFALERNLL